MHELPNWIDSFCEYIEDTECPKIFAQWTAISMIAAALRKKVHFRLGRLKIYPNLYIILVAPPGTARKSTSISYGKDILSSITDVVISAESNTRESLLNDLEASATDFIMPDGSNFKFSALTIISKEFEIFLGQKKDNTKLIVLLTDLFDGEENIWKYKTKNSGTNFIPSVFVNLAAATTPSSLASCLSSDAIGGGLTTRILFIYHEKKDKIVAIPEETPKMLLIKQSLIMDLIKISRIAGAYSFSEEARREFTQWYIRSQDCKIRICKDEAFAGWYERKHVFLVKIATICKAAESDDMTVEWRYFQKALQLLDEVESCMALAFRGVGRSEITADVDMVLKIIKAKKYISEKELMALVWRDIDSKKMDLVLATITRGGFVRQLIRDPEGNAGIFYSWMKGE